VFGEFHDFRITIPSLILLPHGISGSPSRPLFCCPTGSPSPSPSPSRLGLCSHTGSRLMIIFSTKFMNIESKLDKSQSQLTKSTPHVVNVASKESKLGKSEIKTLQRPFSERTCSRRRLPTSPRRTPTSGGMPATSCRMRPTSRRWTTKTCRRPVRVRFACERARTESECDSVRATDTLEKFCEKLAIN
jgi:hypothetical protein